MDPLHPTGIDAYKPKEIAELLEAAGAAKARLPLVSMLTLAMLAGAFIALGAAAYTMVMTGADAGFGPHRFLGGLVFSLGLVLVIVGGAELFTGNALMIMAAVDGKVGGGELARAWTVVYVGNLLGALVLAGLFAGTGLLDGAMGATARAIAEGKAALDPLSAFFRGVLCNVLVCLAVWLSIAARSATGKILAVLLPVSTFVLLGLEHSIANMFFFPQGLAAGADIGLTPILTNLAVVTLGNILGGAGGVALSYRLAYRPV
ncbi:formate/nitrite transporter family protein [Albidovulum sediminicola]|uniref:Formate/nitrite transporter family protein n=1 Tax=Albidovulum sediminicola TaxID=2984331 RepID=A0ABT2Z1C3_9RHOB|nr:formate/nitrite transporter family protein [Defluviimonas sp. WL0075]MCV2864943.1 formate/nitrite transporter family protein [Defluviimonas sp. WL0075]